MPTSTPTGLDISVAGPNLVEFTTTDESLKHAKTGFWVDGSFDDVTAAEVVALIDAYNVNTVLPITRIAFKKYGIVTDPTPPASMGEYGNANEKLLLTFGSAGSDCKIALPAPKIGILDDTLPSNGDPADDDLAGFVVWALANLVNEAGQPLLTLKSAIRMQPKGGRYDE